MANQEILGLGKLTICSYLEVPMFTMEVPVGSGVARRQEHLSLAAVTLSYHLCYWGYHQDLLWKIYEQLI